MIQKNETGGVAKIEITTIQISGAILLLITVIFLIVTSSSFLKSDSQHTMSTFAYFMMLETGIIFSFLFYYFHKRKQLEK